MARHGDATWSSPRVLSTLVIIFLCGTAFGSVCMRTYLRAHWATPVARQSAIDQAQRVGLQTLATRLSLADAQKQEITKILDDYGKFYQNIEDERQDVAQDGIKRIFAVLNPEQRKIFNELLAQNAR